MSSASPQPVPTHSVKIIPLQNIWALDMPGTYPMNRTRRSTPLTYESPEGQLVDEIRAALKYDPQQHPTTGACFVVQGTGMTALQNAHAVLVGGEQPSTVFRSGEGLSLVFYSFQFGDYVHLAEVLDKEELIEIRYRFVPHRTEEVTVHLALIPINSPLPGARRVHVKPMANGEGTQRVNETWGEKIVCGSGSFVISDQ